VSRELQQPVARSGTPVSMGSSSLITYSLNIGLRSCRNQRRRGTKWKGRLPSGLCLPFGGAIVAAYAQSKGFWKASNSFPALGAEWEPRSQLSLNMKEGIKLHFAASGLLVGSADEQRGHLTAVSLILPETYPRASLPVYKVIFFRNPGETSLKSVGFTATPMFPSSGNSSARGKQTSASYEAH